MEELRQLELVMEQDRNLKVEEENLDLKRKLRGMERRIIQWQRSMLLCQIAFKSGISLTDIPRMIVTKTGATIRGDSDA
jgi:IS1 family transposase